MSPYEKILDSYVVFDRKWMGLQWLGTDLKDLWPPGPFVEVPEWILEAPG